MLEYMFNSVDYPGTGSFRISFIAGDNEYRTGRVFLSRSKEDLFGQWKMFAYGNGIALSNVVGIECA